MKTKTIISTVAIAIISCITVFNLQAQDTRRTAFGEPAQICRCLPQNVEIRGTITGTVTNEQGEPLSGVFIKERILGRAVHSNNRGVFSIVVPENGILHFQHFLYLTQEISVDSQREVNVVMKANPEVEDTEGVPRIELNRRIGGGGARRIEGVVRDNRTNEPLIGVRVTVQGTNRGTRTDFDGQFSITIPSSPLDATLQFSCMDYQTQEIVVTHSTRINVVMIYCEEMASREVTDEDLVHDFIETTFGSVINNAPRIPIRVTVTGSFNEPLLALITVEGRTPTPTNLRGHFVASVPENGVILIEYPGVPSQKIVHDGQQEINVVMETHLLPDDDERLIWNLEFQNSLLMEAKSLRDEYFVVRTETTQRFGDNNFIRVCTCCLSPTTSQTISGTVTNLENEPIGGVDVLLIEENWWTRRTNSVGHFIFSRSAVKIANMDPVELEISAWGRYPQTISIPNGTVQTTVPMIVDREFVDTFIENTLRGQAKRESMN